MASTWIRSRLFPRQIAARHGADRRDRQFIGVGVAPRGRAARRRIARGAGARSKR
jgi:hypothetical protein